jgi:hypothetical protein
MMGQEIIPPGHIRNPHPRLQALGHNPRFHLIRPMPFATPPRLHNLAPADKPIPAIRHTSLHLLAQTFWQTRHPSETREINGAWAALTFERCGVADHPATFAEQTARGAAHG